MLKKTKVMECVICQEWMTSNDVFYTPCSHTFDYRCITEWLKTSRACPQCRQYVHPKELRRLHVNLFGVTNLQNELEKCKEQVDDLNFQLAQSQGNFSPLEVVKMFAVIEDKQRQLKEDLMILKAKNRAQELKIKELLNAPSLSAEKSEKNAKQGAKTYSKENKGDRLTVDSPGQAIASRTRSRTRH